MTQPYEAHLEELRELSSREMQEVLGGATVDYFLKLRTIDGEATHYVGSANGGVWKTTNF